VTGDLRFAVLGPVRAWRGQVELEIGPKQQRALLAMLLIKAGQPVNLDDLVALLWEEDPPSSAVNSVHKYVGRIRRQLEQDLASRDPGRWLVRHSGGYRLMVDQGQVDLLVFRDQLGKAYSALARADTDTALALFQRGLSLWHGRCAEGAALTQRARAVLTAIDREYLTAVGAAADAAIAARRPEQVLPELRGAALSEPLNESLQARLILLLAAAGQQGAALAHYQEVREHLADELGVDPGKELRSAHERVLRQEVPPAGPTGGIRPGATSAHPQSATGVQNPTPSTSSGGLATPLVGPAQLPADLPTFAGRQEELARLAALVDSPAEAQRTIVIVAIDGMAGMGKTTLAVHWAHRVSDRYPDAQLYLNLRGFDARDPATAPGDALRSLLFGLGVQEQQVPASVDARAALYRSLLTGRRVLVMLDNARDVEQVRPLLPSGPGNLVVITSRNLLSGLAAADGAHLVTLGLPSFEAARHTLARRIGADRVAAEPDAVGDIITHCGRLPLALAIVASRAAAFPDFPLAGLAADLRLGRGSLDAFDMVDASSDARTVFSWSYHLLGSSAARLFRLLSLVPGMDVTVAASTSLLGVTPRAARSAMVELRSTSLVIEHIPGRFIFHDLIRAYAGELCDGTDTPAEREAARARILEYYLHSGYAAQVTLNTYREPIPPAAKSPGVTPESPLNSAAALSWFAAEHQALAAAVRLSANSTVGVPAWQLALTMQDYYSISGTYLDWLDTTEIALNAAREANDRAGQAHVLRSRAGAYNFLGRLDEALEDLWLAQKLFTDLGHVGDDGYIHSALGMVYIRMGKPELALAHQRAALEIHRKAGNRRAEPLVGHEIGRALHSLGEYDAAISCLLEATGVAREIGALHDLSDGLTVIAEVHLSRGDHDRALDYVNEALGLSRQLGDLRGVGISLRALGDIRRALADDEGARTAWQEAYTIFDGLGQSAVAIEDIRQRLRNLADQPRP